MYPNPDVIFPVYMVCHLYLQPHTGGLTVVGIPISGLDAFTLATYITSTLSATLSFGINLLVLLLVPIM